jgi:hypothetical protein
MIFVFFGLYLCSPAAGVCSATLLGDQAVLFDSNNQCQEIRSHLVPPDEKGARYECRKIKFDPADPQDLPVRLPLKP